MMYFIVVHGGMEYMQQDNCCSVYDFVRLTAVGTITILKGNIRDLHLLKCNHHILKS